MNVKLLSAYTEPAPNFVPAWLTAHCDTSGHTVVEDAEEADLIIFAETYASLDPFFFDVLRHPVQRRHPNKCVLYHYSDLVPTLCRTVSPSVEGNQPNLAFRRTFHYIARRRDNPSMDSFLQAAYHPRLLFSFVGSVRTHPVRREIMKLKHGRALLKDTSAIESELLDQQAKSAFHASFIDSTLDSKFILCPRGLGPTSMRLFEVMQLGRVPVMIGDSWSPVPGIDWNACSISVAERDVARIPALLEDLESGAEEMGQSARHTWETHFAPAKAFHALVDAASSLLDRRYAPWTRVRDLGPLCNPSYFRMLAGYFKRNLPFRARP